jgi:multiple sugar transport system permease protein
MSSRQRQIKNIGTGMAFLLPNLLGFLAFTMLPLLMSIYMAFTDWNLEMHNYFRAEPIRFVGFRNFAQLFTDPDFGRYLGNTFFLMIGIPFGVAASLGSAILLSLEFRGSRRFWGICVVTAVMLTGCLILTLAGMGATAMTMLMASLLGSVFVLGSIGGRSVYRTLFYFPHFTSGVATFILWKKLYAPENGPINNALRPLMSALTPLAGSLLPFTDGIVTVLLLLLMALFALMVFRKMRRWEDGECGHLSALLGMIVLSTAPALSMLWIDAPWLRVAMPLLLLLGWLWFAWHFFGMKRIYDCVLDYKIGDSTMVDGLALVGGLALIGLAKVVWNLPELVSQPEGLPLPKWIADYYWAKPSIILMGFWSAVGSNNMLLYLAGLSGVPQDLYEAADIDGASRWQRFWHVTWPQLANVTFFIMVMAIIGGIQGGFEMARVMTNGGPAGSTTTLSYYIYTQGFATGRLGYASAVAWLLFLLMFVVTMFNWKFGNRYTND